MINYMWPITLAIVANIIYQICAKSVPADMHPVASITVTYAVAMVASFAIYFIMEKEADIIGEYAKLNWAPIAFGLVLVCLEVGFIFAYRAGWQVNTAFIVQSATVAVGLLFVGYFLYREPLTWNKIAGALICLAGLGVINYK